MESFLKIRRVVRKNEKSRIQPQLDSGGRSSGIGLRGLWEFLRKTSNIFVQLTRLWYLEDLSCLTVAFDLQLDSGKHSSVDSNCGFSLWRW